MKSVLVVLVVLFSLQVTAQYKLTDKIPTDASVKIGKLSNGLTYYIRKNPKPEKKLELRLVVNAGSVLENNDQRGLAHFMEHMSFNGSKNFPKNELVDFLQKSGVEFGADLNAYTNFDETVYILPIPTDDPTVVEKGFTVLEDWAFNNLFDKTEIDKERGVVLEESRLSKNADDRMVRKYIPKLLNGSKYAERLTIGKDEILKTFKPETLKSFYKNWYRPNNIAVVVVGDIDPAEAEKKIIAHFGKFTNPATAPVRPSIIPIAQRTKAEAMVLTDDEATNTLIEIYNFIKPAKRIITWANYRESLVEGLVSSLINQRLGELAQKENPPFVYASTGYSEFIRGYNSFTSLAVVGEGTPQVAIDALFAETNRARQFGFLTTELDRAKASILNSAEKAFNEKDKSESFRIIDQYVNNFLQGSPIPGAENRYKFLKQVLPTISLQEINAAAKKMPSVDKAFAMIEAPTSMKDKLPDNVMLLKDVIAATKKPVKPYEEKAVASQLLGNEPAAGKITAETKNEKLGTTDLTLSNGITITLKPTTFKNDQIQMDAWRWGGFQNFDLSDKQNAQYAANIVSVMGVKDMSPTDIRKFLAGKTVSVTPYLNDHEEGIEGGSSVKDFETFLQMVYLYLTQPRKDEAAFKSFVSKYKGQLQFAMLDPQTWFQDTMTRIIYNNNPWVQTVPTPAEFGQLNLDRSFEIYKSIFGNAYGMHFTFDGNLDLATVKPLLEKYLGSLPATPKENKFKDNGIRLIKGITDGKLKRGKEKQSVILMQWEGDAEYNREERMNLSALLEVMNIRITEKLREEMSDIYGGGMSGSIVKRPYVHYVISAYLPCGPENVDKLSNALMGLIKDAQEKGIEQKDLDKVKETWKKQYHVNLQSNDFWLSSLSTAWIDQNNPENILDYEQKVDALTVDGLKAAAKKYITLNNMVKFVLYPESSDVKQEVKTLKAF